jgi:hypothetical protein
MVAPRQKLRVMVNSGDQNIHFLGAVPDKNGLANGFHIKGQFLTIITY